MTESVACISPSDFKIAISAVLTFLYANQISSPPEKDAGFEFISVGQTAYGFIAIGQQAVGVIAIGQVAIGVVTLGQGSIITS